MSYYEAANCTHRHGRMAGKNKGPINVEEAMARQTQKGPQRVTALAPQPVQAQHSRRSALMTVAKRRQRARRSSGADTREFMDVLLKLMERIVVVSEKGNSRWTG